jgi:hypothetical protein
MAFLHAGGHVDAKSLLKWEKTLAKFFLAR